ncbi:citrate synthase [Kitasatospora cathayae]|uniref:citrate synthase (unknown stereospecificity) n=1 Tax=Kitasatospora cathayae TaxID=3004092 RepID=A0ABY7PX61_9ACTN|nr:citrate synthase [Kitasatospora sp. HUAS 3-15]WBP85028.1 citrate synthase [Kitasatospora sp. HUAS 3-15]
MTERLTTQQVAEQLGVKVETVYAYASRGQLSSERAPGGKGSTFDAREVAELAARGRRAPVRPPAGEAPAGEPWAGGPVTVRTELTLIENGRLYYRGRDAVELAAEHGFEAAIGWLWGLGTDAPVALRVPPTTADALTRAAAALPDGIRLPDRLRISATVAAALDPLRFDLREQTVLAAGAALIAGMVEALPRTAPDPDPGPDAPLAARLWSRLATTAPAPEALTCLDRALVLLIDHELAVSTVAARVAASARAHPYAVVSAGLGATDGPLHGAASPLAHRMLAEVLADGAVPVVSDYLRTGRPIPGLGHRLYPQGDPRAVALLDAVGRLDGGPAVVAAVTEVEAAAGPAGRPALRANIDLALAAMALAAGLPAQAGEVVFAVARTPGWIAHAVEEYREEPLRMRARGHYTGPRPRSAPNAPLSKPS